MTQPQTKVDDYVMLERYADKLRKKGYEVTIRVMRTK